MAMNPTDTTEAQDANQATLPVRNENIPARNLDPDYQGGEGGLDVDMSHTYTKGGSGSVGDAARDAKDQAKDQAKDVARDAAQSLKSGANDLKQQAGDVGNRVKDQAKQAYDEVRQFSGDALEKAQQQWGETSGKAADRARQFADTQKGRLAGGLDDAAAAARAVVDKLGERDDDAVARYARTAADGLESARDYLHNADVSELLDGAKRFTRRHPEWVIGGLFVAGLAAARFLKADRPDSSGRRTTAGGRGRSGMMRGRSTHPGRDDLFEDVEHSQHGDYPHAFEEIERKGGSKGGMNAGSDIGSPVGLNNPAGHTQATDLPPATPASPLNTGTTVGMGGTL